MKRRELFSKLFAVAATGAVTAAGLSALEPKPKTGEWCIGAPPMCPECGMVVSVGNDPDRKLVFMHPEFYYEGEEQRRWPCRNAGRKFYLATHQCEEYFGEMKTPHWYESKS